jgi:hypothetical protein
MCQQELIAVRKESIPLSDLQTPTPLNTASLGVKPQHEYQ